MPGFSSGLKTIANRYQNFSGLEAKQKSTLFSLSNKEKRKENRRSPHLREGINMPEAVVVVCANSPVCLVFHAVM